MAQLDTQAILDFVSNVPSDVNPYSAVAHHLIELLTPPAQAHWTRPLQRVAIFGYSIMFLQSCYLFCIAIRSKAPSSLTFNNLKLLRIDCSSACGVGFGIFSALVIADLILAEAIAAGKDVVGRWFLVIGYEFLALVYLGLIFLWACVCQCASLKWKSPNHQGPSFGKQNIPKSASWIMHLLFLVSLVWPVPLVLINFADAKDRYQSMRHSVISVSETLLNAADSFSPETHNNYRVLLLLSPLQSVLVQADLMSRSLRSGMLVYLICIGTAMLAYIPIATFTLQGLFPDKISQWRASEKPVILSKGHSQQLTVTGKRNHRKRKLVVARMIGAFSAYLLHVPVLIWLILRAKGFFFYDPTVLSVCHLGLHGPYVLAGNITLFFLISEAQMVTPSADDTLETAPPSLMKRNNLRKFLATRHIPTLFNPQSRTSKNSNKDAIDMPAITEHKECLVSQYTIGQRQFFHPSRSDDSEGATKIHAAFSSTSDSIERMRLEKALE